jgi:hypothetical protein
MADPSVTPASTVEIASGTAGANAASVLAQSAAALAAVATSLSEMMTKMNSALSSLSENVNKIAAASTTQTTVGDEVSRAAVLGTVHTSGKHESDVEVPESIASTNAASIARAQAAYDRIFNLGIARDEALHQLTMQVLQNGIETANMIAKQAVRHVDLAIDRQWNERAVPPKA